jgi:hypothetical protein
VLQALWCLGRTAIKKPFLTAVGLVATVASIIAGNVLAILLSAGLATVVHGRIKEGRFVGNLVGEPKDRFMPAPSIPLALVLLAL